MYLQVNALVSPHFTATCSMLHILYYTTNQQNNAKIIITATLNIYRVKIILKYLIYVIPVQHKTHSLYHDVPTERQYYITILYLSTIP